MSAAKPYLTSDQVHALNEKHGWFQFADAQSEVSRAFAQDAIAMHERIRAAAPELLEALEKCMEALSYYDNNLTSEFATGVSPEAPVVIRAQRLGAAAIAKAVQP